MVTFCGQIIQTSLEVYRIKEDCGTFKWTDEMIEGLAEEGIQPLTLDNSWECPQGYQFVDENGNVINATKIVLKKKRKEYLKTYEECCKVLDWNHRDYDRVGYESELLCKFQVLLLCRDAYWKIAGEEIGLGKPWEPDWKKGYQSKYCICNNSDNIKKISLFFDNAILSFPTLEMRDAFYQNFKNLIEICKELL